MSRKGKKSDIPDDYIPPPKPADRAMLDHFAAKVAQFRDVLSLDVGTINKWGQKDTPERRQMVLFVLKCGHTYKMAQEVIGVSRETLRRWRFNEDGTLTDFGQECEEAYEEGTDVHEEEFLRRAKEGVLKPVYQGGVLVGHTREFSDGLMTMLMQGRRSRVYGKQKLEVSGENGTPIAHTHKMEIEFVKATKKKGDE